MTKTNSKTGITKEEKRTQAGWVILLAFDIETSDNENVHVLNWVSRKLTRFSKSTLASDAIARVGAVEDAIRIDDLLEEIYSANVTTKELLVKQETGG